MRRAVVDLRSSRPVWRAPADTIRKIKEALGSGWSVSRVRAVASSDGDGAAASPAAERAAVGAEIYIGWGVPGAVVAAGSRTLRWVHSAAAGVRASLTPELRASRAVFTNSKGIQAEPMADWVLAAVAFCLRGFHGAVSAQAARRWAKDDFTDGTLRLREFRDTRVGIFGLGEVGRAVARRAAALGMRVAAIRRRRSTRVPRGVAWVGGPDDLATLARESDVLVIATAHTAATDRVVSDRILSALPRGAFLVNVARGRIVEEDALVRALDGGRVAGCVLDVFHQEPLPRSHPFWRHPGVVVFPHSSAVSDRFWPRQTELIVANVGRYLAGRRLRNVVNLEAGY